MSYRLNYLFATVLCVGIIQLIYFYPYLPETMATHFGADGQADGWSSRSSFISMQVIIIGVMTMLYLSANKLKLPQSSKYISLPNKDYWLDASRRSQTEYYLAQQMRWFCFYTLLFLLVVIQLVINANLQSNGLFDENLMWYSLLIYGVYIVVWILRFYRRFNIKK